MAFVRIVASIIDYLLDTRIYQFPPRMESIIGQKSYTMSGCTDTGQLPNVSIATYNIYPLLQLKTARSLRSAMVSS